MKIPHLSITITMNRISYILVLIYQLQINPTRAHPIILILVLLHRTNSSAKHQPCKNRLATLTSSQKKTILTCNLNKLTHINSLKRQPLTFQKMISKQTILPNTIWLISFLILEQMILPRWQNKIQHPYSSVKHHSNHFKARCRVKQYRMELIL